MSLSYRAYSSQNRSKGKISPCGRDFPKRAIMTFFVPLLLLLSSFMQADKEAQAFLKSLYTATECKKCIPPSNDKLLVFISFSMPLESWKEWSYSLEKEGGIF